MSKILLLIVALVLVSVNVSYAKDSFIITSLDEATRLSEQTKQPILLIFGADYCKFCDNLKTDINNRQLNEVIDNLIICYIDVDKNTELKHQYKVKAIPDSRLIKKKIQLINIVGYSKQNYIDKLKNVK
jgi:thioredoxin-related protein